MRPPSDKKSKKYRDVDGAEHKNNDNAYFNGRFHDFPDDRLHLAGERPVHRGAELKGKIKERALNCIEIVDSGKRRAEHIG